MTPHELRTRLALDAEVVARLRSPHLGAIRGYASAARFERREVATAAELVGGRALFWTVEYRFPMLAGPGRSLASATAAFNLLAGGNYPFTAPTVAFVSRPFPWCGHVNPSTGSVCVGEGWARARGQITLAHLVVHVLRLANFDEPPTDDGNDLAALRYGREMLGGRPLNPDLVYPALPADLLHGVDAENAVEEEAPARALFIPRVSAPRPEMVSAANVFVPRGSTTAPTPSGLFVPHRVLR